MEPAREYYSRAIALAPGMEKALQNLATLEARGQNYDAAVKLFSKVISRPAALNNVGYLCMLDGYYAEAIDYFEKAIDESPSYYATAVENLQHARDLLNQRGRDDAPVTAVD